MSHTGLLPQPLSLSSLIYIEKYSMGIQVKLV